MATTMATIQSLVERGLAKPVSFEDLSQDNNGVIPNKRHWFGPFPVRHIMMQMEIYTSLSSFQEHVESLLSTIEGVRYYWEPTKCVWIIEYGTPPLEYKKTGKEVLQIFKGRCIANEAAQVACEKFPHLAIYDDNLYENNIIPLYDDEPSGWCKMELRIYTDTQKDCLFITLNRETGSRSTNLFVWRIIKSYFNENKIFISRASYLKLMEGIDFHRGNHIIRYVGDCMVKRELCTYFQYE